MNLIIKMNYWPMFLKNKKKELNDELKIYLQEGVVSDGIDILDWWKVCFFKLIITITIIIIIKYLKFFRSMKLNFHI
jgi:hypothetical protein